jgi:DNA-binding transcriptional regulator YhcF (GntR family)
MALDFSDNKSIFLQIAAMIENDILRGILQEDEQVLSTNEIAKLYNINPNTALKGISVLFTEDILYKKRGVGMFVAAGAKEKILNKRKKEFFDEYVQPMLREAKAIGISKNELLKLIIDMEENENI